MSDYPIAYHFGRPIRSSTEPLLTSVNDNLGSPNDSAHVGTTLVNLRRKQRMTPRDIEELASWLSDRDFAILRSVDEHQFLTVKQVEALHFADHAPISAARTARRTLARLRNYRLLGTLERRIGGVKAGSVSLVHYLDVIGDQLLHNRSGRQAQRRSRDPSCRFLSHRLAVADSHIALVKADRQGDLELVACAVEPASWRRFTGLGGGRLTLKPDLYVETTATRNSDFVDAWFVEVDLGTESIQTLLRKCRDYETYRRTGIEQERDGGFPLVVWSVTHRDPRKAERRRQTLREAIDEDPSLTGALFCVIRPDQFIATLGKGGQA